MCVKEQYGKAILIAIVGEEEIPLDHANVGMKH
jgi:hypothetical protein